jgi:hypothetical protein
MNIHFNVFSYDTVSSFFKESITPSLTNQNKKIIAIASIIFGLLATAYLVYQSCCKTSKISPNLDEDDIVIDDPDIQKTVDNNLDLIQQDFLDAIEAYKKDGLGDLYDYLYDKNPQLKKVKSYLATIGVNSKGEVKSMEYGYPSQGNRQLLLYGSDVSKKREEWDIDKPVLQEGSLYFYKVIIEYTSDKNDNDNPFSLEDPITQPHAQVIEFMIKNLNKRIAQAAWISNFKSLPQVKRDWIV